MSKYLNSRISELADQIHNTFKSKEHITCLIMRDIETGSNLFQELSDRFKQIAKQNEEIHRVYMKMEQEVEDIFQKKKE